MIDLSAVQRQKVRSVFDAMIEHWGKDCVLHFPHTRTECPNCVVNTADGRSSGVARGDASQPFPSGTVCPVCTGEGYIESADTRTVKMRLYDDPAEWEGRVPVQVPAGTIQCKCKLEHYAAVVAAGRMTVDAEGYRERDYALWGDPVDASGIVQGEYLLSWWKRA